MNIAEYWNEKTALLENAFEGWQKKEEIQVRKLIIAKMMDIPEDRLTYYLKRDIWYLNFVLGDDSEIDRIFAMKDSTKEKVQKILVEYFYQKDYDAISGIEIAENAKVSLFERIKRLISKLLRRNKVSDASVTDIDKDTVCNCIKKRVDKKVYKELNISEKALVDILEKIYFDPLALFNADVEENIDSETYYTILMEQWKTANEMAANISAQRNNMNNFYMSLMSILVGGILFSNRVMSSNIFFQTMMYAVIIIFGIVCCNKWISQIENYGRLNGEKYNVINALERKLPANVMLYEYMHTEKTSRKSNEKISFSEQEKGIAKLFRFAISALSGLMLLGVWGEYIWTIIQK